MVCFYIFCQFYVGLEVIYVFYEFEVLYYFVEFFFLLLQLYVLFIWYFVLGLVYCGMLLIGFFLYYMRFEYCLV